MSGMMLGALSGVTRNEISAPGSEDALTRCLERIDALIDVESSALRACALIDFDEFNQKKTHLLLEFTRLSRTLPGRSSEALRPRLERLSGKLAENAQLLDLHLGAMLEISRIMISSIQANESDGTYSSRPPTPRER